MVRFLSLSFSLLSLVLVGLAATAAASRLRRFPDGFLIGASSASYQVEGAWNEDGKGENIWDHIVHEHPEYIVDKSSGDVADDSYHLYKKDVAALKEVGFDFYRFSVSWARVLPQGDTGVVNELGLRYYDSLIDELLANGIQPMVTMFHWDLPWALQELGGWANPVIAEYFEDYARLLFERYGDRVKWWITLNEPLEFTGGYATMGRYPPSVDKPGVGDYLAAHTVLLAHARVYRMYHREFRPKQRGKITITLNSDWIEPNTTSPEDTAAADRALQFELGWYAHPVYSEEGDYPKIMREKVDANSASEGRLRSRLPYFTPAEVDFIRGTFDFFALNHYSTRLATTGECCNSPSRGRDSGTITWQDSSWPGSSSSWQKSVPWGFRKILNWIHNNFNGLPIVVTENGYSDSGEIMDKKRVEYYVDYLTELLKAVHDDGVNVIGYTAWSIIDNFEWNAGYTERFGLYHINYTDSKLKRTPKCSSVVLKNIISTRELPEKPPVCDASIFEIINKYR